MRHCRSCKVDKLVSLTKPELHNNSSEAHAIHSWLKTVRESLARSA
jgi:hypothetical protein